MHRLFGIIVLVMKKDKLEKIQIEAERLVIGTARSISVQKLYEEICWLTLAERRK